MKAKISFDLIMTDDMPFVEGSYYLEDGVWQVFTIYKSRGLYPVGVVKDRKWKSGVTGLNIVLPDDVQIDKSLALKLLCDAVEISQWVEIRGPDSMNLRSSVSGV